MILEFVSGGDLSKPIKEGRRPLESELRIWLRCVLLGLEHLHLSGIIHRDIKARRLKWMPFSLILGLDHALCTVAA